MNKLEALKQEHKKLSVEYVKNALTKENKTHNYLNKFSVINRATGEIYNLSFSYDKYIKEYYNNIIQRVMYNKVIAKQNNLIPIFITFTAPSRFHPFRNNQCKNKDKNKNKCKFDINKAKYNKNFKFDSINAAAEQAYKFLDNVIRVFYLRIKNHKSFRKESKNIRYDLFFEYHKSYIPHAHILLYIPKEMKDYVFKAFYKILSDFKMNKKGNKIKEIEEQNKKGKKLNSLDGAVHYISKYIKKNLENIQRNKVELLMFIGYKQANNIRIYRGSRTKLPLYIYTKLYKQLNENEKEIILKRAKRNNTCLLYELEQLTNIKTTIVNVKTKTIKTKYIQKKKYNKFYIDVTKQKYLNINATEQNIKSAIITAFLEIRANINKDVIDLYTFKNVLIEIIDKYCLENLIINKIHISDKDKKELDNVYCLYFKEKHEYKSTKYYYLLEKIERGYVDALLQVLEYVKNAIKFVKRFFKLSFMRFFSEFKEKLLRQIELQFKGFLLDIAFTKEDVKQTYKLIKHILDKVIAYNYKIVDYKIYKLQVKQYACNNLTYNKQDLLIKFA